MGGEGRWCGSEFGIDCDSFSFALFDDIGHDELASALCDFGFKEKMFFFGIFYGWCQMRRMGRQHYENEK